MIRRADELSQKSQSQPEASPGETPSESSPVSLSQPPFPVDVLPLRVLWFVLEVSTALLVDPSIIAAPCLAVLAGCIGNRRRITVNPGAWTEPAILWLALVLPSGGRKTPALSAALSHLQEREVAELEEEKARRAEYEEEMAEWKKAPANERGDPPEKPEPARRLLVSDITTEGLLSVHARAPLGLLLYRDELGGWLRSYNQYKAGARGADAQTWCETHQGHPTLIDRKGDLTLSVPRAAVSIVGGIQPELLRDALSGEHLYDGIASRLLFVVPPESVKTWTDDTISAEARKGWTSLQNELLALQPDPGGDPIDLPMTEEAKTEWVRFYEEHAQREHEAKGPFRSALSKLEGATARLALLIQLADDPKSKEVGVKAMKAGIELSEWFEDQARRVYYTIEKGKKESDRRDLCKWIAAQGGATTQRDVARLGPYKFRKRAKEALEDLVSEDFAKRLTQIGNKGDRFSLTDAGKAEGAAR